MKEKVNEYIKGWANGSRRSSQFPPWLLFLLTQFKFPGPQESEPGGWCLWGATTATPCWQQLRQRVLSSRLGSPAARGAGQILGSGLGLGPRGLPGTLDALQARTSSALGFRRPGPPPRPPLRSGLPSLAPRPPSVGPHTLAATPAFLLLGESNVNKILAPSASCLWSAQVQRPKRRCEIRLLS